MLLYIDISNSYSNITLPYRYCLLSFSFLFIIYKNEDS